MRKQHPQRNLLLLGHKRPIILQHLDLLQLRTKLVDLLVIIEAQLALLNSLQASNGGEDLGARRNPEDRVQGHVLFGVEASLPGSAGDDLIAILVDGDKDQACDSGGFVAGNAVERLLDRFLRFRVDHFVV